MVQFRRLAGYSAVVELIYSHLPGKYVHSLAGDEVQHTAFDLGRAALAVGTEPLGLVARLHEHCPAHRATLRELRLLAVFGTLFKFHAGDFRDDFPSFLDVYPVADAYVHLLHQRGVVEGGALYHRAAELHRGEVCDRSYGSRPAYLVVYAQHRGACLLRLEFECHRPARGFGRVAERTLAGELVDFDYYAVRGVRQELAL